MKGFPLSLIFINLFFINLTFTPPSQAADETVTESETVHISAKARLYIDSLMSSPDPVSEILSETGRFLTDSHQEQLIEDLEILIQAELESPFIMRSLVKRKENKLQVDENKARTTKEKRRIEKERAKIEDERIRIDWNWENIVTKAIEKFLGQNKFILGRDNIRKHVKKIKKIPGQTRKKEIRFLRNFLRELNIDTSKTEALKRILNHLRNQELSLARDSIMGKNPYISDEETLSRILIHFKLIHKSDDFSSLANKAKYSSQSGQVMLADDWRETVSLELESSLRSKKDSSTNNRGKGEHIYFEFAETVKEGYREPLNRSTRKAINLLQRILRAERIGAKEVSDFRDILELLKLPPEFYNNEFIRHYLSSIQMEQVQKLYKTANIEFNETMTDKQALFFLSRVKENFEKPHYDLLKDQTKFKNFAFGFPPQFLIYHISIGAVIFLEHFITDVFLYQSHKNPVPMETWMQGLAPEAWFSLGFFIFASSQAQFQVHKWGVKINSNLLKALATPAGMAAGYLLSSILIEIYQDEELHECAKNMVKRHKENKHITSCEASALKWQSKFFVDIGPDIITLLGAGWISQKAISRLALLMRTTKWGDRFLVKAASRLGRFTGHIGGIIQIIGFFVANEFMDRYCTKILKETILSNKSRHGMGLINSRLMDERAVLPGRIDLLKEKLKALNDDQRNSLKDKLKDLGYDQNDTENNFYNTLFKSLSDQNDKESDSDDNNLFNTIQVMITDIQERWKDLIETTKELDFNFKRWNEVKGIAYLQIFQSWKVQTEKLIDSFDLAEARLREMYALSHKTRMGPLNKYLDEVIKKRHREIKALTTDYVFGFLNEEKMAEVFRACDSFPIDRNTIQTRIHNLNMKYQGEEEEEKGRKNYIKHFTSICRKSHSVISESLYDFFSISIEELHNPEFIHVKDFACSNYEDYIIELDLEQWAILCYESRITSIENFKWETVQLISHILNSSEFEYLDDIQIDEARDYIGWGINEIFSNDNKINSLSVTDKLALARRLLNQEHPVLPDESVRGAWIYMLCESEYFSGAVPVLLCPQSGNEDVFIEQWVNRSNNLQFINNPEISGSLNYIDGLLSEKAQIAGFYLLKDVLNNHEVELRNLPSYFSHIRLRNLADPFEVHKKGELSLNNLIEENDLSSVNEIQNKILQALICGTEEGEISKDFLFIPPKIFTGTKSLCESLSEDSSTPFTERLFKNPVVSNGDHYETAYLAIEALIQESFNTEEELVNSFRDKTLHLKEEMHQTKLKDLDNLADNFLIPNLIPSEEKYGMACLDQLIPNFTPPKKKHGMSCSELKSYYNQSDRNFEGLEIPLFQINYNLNQLKNIMDLGIEENLNSENQDDIHCEVLRLLQGWYDNYVNNESLNEKPDRFVFPESSFLRELMADAWEEAKDPSTLYLKKPLIERIRTRYSANMIYIDKAFLFHDILKEFAPEYNDVNSVMERIVYGNDQFTNEINSQFANWDIDIDKWLAVSPLIVGAYKMFFHRSDEEIQDKVIAATEEESCVYPQKALTDIIAEKKEPYYKNTFPPVQAPIIGNCRLGFDDERNRMIYTTLVSLYEGLGRFYTSFVFLIQTQKLKAEFAR